MAEKVLERKPLWCLTISVEKLIKNLFLAIRKLPILYKMTAFLKLLKSGLSSSWSFHEIGDASGPYLPTPISTFLEDMRKIQQYTGFYS
jgi:hypothetical protein